MKNTSTNTHTSTTEHTPDEHFTNPLADAVVETLSKNLETAVTLRLESTSNLIVQGLVSIAGGYVMTSLGYPIAGNAATEKGQMNKPSLLDGPGSPIYTDLRN